WSEDRLVPDMIRGLTDRHTITLRNPGAVRPWQHVLEPLHGYLLLGKALIEREASIAEAWNFGAKPEECVTVRDLADRIVRLWGEGRLEIQSDGDSLHEASMLRLDCTKARIRLGWRPLLSIDDALSLTVTWYRSFYQAPASSHEITERQIA